MKDTVMSSQMDTVFQKSRPERSRYFKVLSLVTTREKTTHGLEDKLKVLMNHMQDYDNLHYTKINASEVCPQNVIIRGLLCLNTV
jgi:hypothetical protein